MVRVVVDAQLLDRAIDLDRVDVPGPIGERDRRVGPGACADDQDLVVRAIGEPLVELVVELLLVGGDGVQRLVGDAVDVDVERAVGDELRRSTPIVCAWSKS